jgi:hypothetical protein
MMMTMISVTINVLAAIRKKVEPTILVGNIFVSKTSRYSNAEMTIPSRGIWSSSFLVPGYPGTQRGFLICIIYLNAIKILKEKERNIYYLGHAESGQT